MKNNMYMYIVYSHVYNMHTKNINDIQIKIKSYFQMLFPCMGNK